MYNNTKKKTDILLQFSAQPVFNTVNMYPELVEGYYRFTSTGSVNHV